MEGTAIATKSKVGNNTTESQKHAIAMRPKQSAIPRLLNADKGSSKDCDGQNETSSLSKLVVVFGKRIARVKTKWELIRPNLGPSESPE